MKLDVPEVSKMRCVRVCCFGCDAGCWHVRRRCHVIHVMQIRCDAMRCRVMVSWTRAYVARGCAGTPCVVHLRVCMFMCARVHMPCCHVSRNSLPSCHVELPHQLSHSPQHRPTHAPSHPPLHRCITPTLHRYTHHSMHHMVHINMHDRYMCTYLERAMYMCCVRWAMTAMTLRSVLVPCTITPSCSPVTRLSHVAPRSGSLAACAPHGISPRTRISHCGAP